MVRFVSSGANVPDGGSAFQHPSEQRATSLDVAYVGDFSMRCDAVQRVVEEVLLNAQIGYRTGIAHMPSTNDQALPIAAGIREAVDTGAALSIDYFDVTDARVVIVAGAATALDKRPRLPVRISADRVLAILDNPLPEEGIRQRHARLVQYFGEEIWWTATAFDVLEQVRSAGLRTLGTIWQAFGCLKPMPNRYHWAKGSRLVIGTACGAGAEHWPTDLNALAAIWDSERYRVRVTGSPPVSDHTKQWDILAPDQRSHVRFASGLNAFVYYPDGRPLDLPLTAIGTCLAAGIPVFLPPHLKSVLGKGPRYVAVESLARELHAEMTESSRPSTTRFDAVEAHRRRMRFWVGGSPARRPRRTGRRALFFSSNGEGLGHVTRLLAIARKLPSDVTPIFGSLSHGIGVIEDAGYHAEMIVSHRYANVDEAAAYPWMADELAEMLSRHAPDVFVFDGGNPYRFMSEVVGPRRRPAYVWMRRGMWRKEQDNSAVIAKERLFDAIIEPSDLAASRDQGATATRKEGVVLTDPIRLIDDDEQLSREEARLRLNLAPDRPAALVQLGPGARRDLTFALKQVFTALQSHPEIQIVNLTTPINRNLACFSDHVTDVTIYPIARFLRAFDFAVSAAGYNSFHELVAARIPTIFLVSMTPELDDQEGRAAFAETAGAGYALKAENLSALPGLLERMADPARRALMQENCGRLSASNGAQQAADLIAELAQ
jgi:UDP:flavonoid glycosyltransferase YjiC (YdhE family)